MKDAGLKSVGISVAPAAEGHKSAIAPTPHESTSRPSAGASRMTQLLFLCAATAVPVLGGMMVTLDGRQVAIAGLESAPLPTLCVSRWLGFDCPTCGLTRSVISLMAGDFAGSIGHHRFGWLILLQIVGQIPYRIYRLGRPTVRILWLEKAAVLTALATGGLVLFNWIGELVVTSGFA